MIMMKFTGDKNCHSKIKMKSKHKTNHHQSEPNLQTLFCNSKILSKKKNPVNLVNGRPGSHKKYSNIKQYNSIPLLNNIKRYLSIDVVRQSKNNQYELIIKKPSLSINDTSPKTHTKLEINNPAFKKSCNFFSKTANHSTQTNNIKNYSNKQFYTSGNFVDWSSSAYKTMKNSSTSNQFYKESFSNFTNRKLSTAFERSRQQSKALEMNRKLFTGQQSRKKKLVLSHHNQNNTDELLQSSSPNKIRSVSQFLIQGINTNHTTSPVWMLNNDY